MIKILFICHGNMRIDFRDMNRAVAKHFLYIEDINVRF